MDSRGVAGVHTDLPSMMIVVVAVAMFMVASGRIVLINEQAEQWDSLEEDAKDLATRFLSCTMMLEEGVMDLRISRMCGSDDLSTELFRNGGWTINVEWDNGTMEWVSGECVGNSFSVQLPVTVYDGDILPARVTVVVWE